MSLGSAQDSTLPSFQLTRDDTVIAVQQTARDSEGGIFVSSKACKEDFASTTAFAPSPFRVETQINDTLIKSNILLREQPSGGQDEAVLHMAGGSLELDEATNCPQNVEEAETAEVTIEEGRTTINGVAFDYDNATGVGIMTGPVALERVAEGDSPALNASSEKLTFNTDEDDIFLEGGVLVTSEDRTSEADELEYDEENAIAVMRGNPAVSTDSEGFVSGDVIIYYLDTNDVVVKGSLSGEIDVDLGRGNTPPTEVPSNVPEDLANPSDLEPGLGLDQE